MDFGPAGSLRGSASVPGDKSISHRALMLSAMAVGQSRIEGISDGTDLDATARALEAMGVRIERVGGAVEVGGVGTGCLLQPAGALDMANSGTSTRLLMGLLASHPLTATFTGDESLCRRPMDRVIGPLRRLGADISASPGARLPLRLSGICPAVLATHRLSVASAQVKSALLLAALNTPGLTRITQAVPTRDHSERLLQRFGADIEIGHEIAIRGESELKPQHLRIPGDASAAAFLIVAALIVPGSEVRLPAVSVNPMRRGLIDLLRQMGADIELRDERDLDGEPVAEIVARHSRLRGVEVPAGMIPAMIDEFPIFFVAAAFAEGASRARGLGELRVKESDRIGAMATGLTAIGARIDVLPDGLTIQGSAGAPLAGGATVASSLDHRVAMSLAVAGLHCREPVTIDDMRPVATSFPGFAATIGGLLP